MLEEMLRRAVEESKGSSELEFVSCDDLFENAMLQVRGGRNEGDGHWEDYFHDLSELVLRLRDLFEGVYVQHLFNDVGEDHFECSFELKRKKFEDIPQ